MIISFTGPKPKRYFFKIFRYFAEKAPKKVLQGLRQISTSEKVSYERVINLAKEYALTDPRIHIFDMKGYGYVIYKRP